jgi:hypothetical protein
LLKPANGACASISLSAFARRGLDAGESRTISEGLLITECRRPRVWIVFALEVLILEIYQISTHLKFDSIAFGDYGLNLSVQFLLRHGYRPYFDFAYPYGSLSLVFGTIWFKMFGLTPLASFAGVAVCDLVFAIGLAVFASRLRFAPAGLVVICIGIPFSILLTISFAHGLERALLCWGLAEQAGERRGSALALATAAVFVKPTMGYVYGFVLIILMVWRSKSRELGVAAVIRELIPACAVGLLLFGLTAVLYGLGPDLRLLFPISGARMYQANHFGFLNSGGRSFWYFPNVHIAYYFGTVCAFWFVAAFLLAVGASQTSIAFFRKSVDAEISRINYEMVLTCAVLHFTFVTLFFGSNASWIDYVYVLVMGAAAMSTWSVKTERIACALVVLGLVGQKAMIAENYHGWVETGPSQETAGLWASADERLEWTKVLDLMRRRRVVLLSGDGAAQLLFPEFEKPVALTLIQGQSSVAEVQRQLAQLRRADMAVVPEVPENLNFLDRSPELKVALSGWNISFRGRFFSVYARS